MVSRNADFEHLEKKLSDPQLSAADLHAIVEQVGLKGRFKPGRIFPIGIPFPDILRTRIDVNRADLKPLIDHLVSIENGLRSWRVFPIGIPAPDRFAVEIDVGRPFAGGSGG